MDDWKAWAVPWKLVVMDAGSVCRATLFTASTAVPEGHVGPGVERERDRGQLAQVVHGQRAHVLGELRHAAERHELAARRADIEQRERGRVLLVLRLHLHDDLVLVVRRVDGRDLLGAVGHREPALHLGRR